MLFTPEDVRTQSSQARHCTSPRIVVRGGRDQVRLEEADAGSRDFDDFGQVRRDDFVKTAVALRGPLQDIDGRVVRVVRQHVAEGEG